MLKLMWVDEKPRVVKSTYRKIPCDFKKYNIHNYDT